MRTQLILGEYCIFRNTGSIASKSNAIDDYSFLSHMQGALGTAWECGGLWVRIWLCKVYYVRVVSRHGVRGAYYTIGMPAENQQKTNRLMQQIMAPTTR